MLVLIGIVLYIYVGYPLLLWLLAHLKGRVVRKSGLLPSVTILIAAHNEAEGIGDTIRNKLELDYPNGSIEIIVVSDGSTDGTDEVVESFSSSGVRLMRQEPRAGKTAALNMGVSEAGGEIIVFSDANSIYERTALRMLASNFADLEVGYVTGKMIYVNDDGSVIGSGCTRYMQYENLMRELETKVGSVVGVDGGIDAVRSRLFRPMRPDQLPDFVLPLMVVEQGYRVVYEPGALLKEMTLSTSSDEYRMRVRVSLRALWALKDMRRLLDFRQFGVFSWQLFSHKWLRYYAYLFLLALFLVSVAKAGASPHHRFALGAQLVFYGAAFVAFCLERSGVSAGILYIPYYFTLLNLAAAHASLKFLLGRKQTTWTPRKG